MREIHMQHKHQARPLVIYKRSLWFMLPLILCCAMPVHASPTSALAILAKSGMESKWVTAHNNSHVQISQRRVSVDGRSAILSRYERRDGRNRGLEGEHLSTLISNNGQLLGFANIDLALLDQPLPSAQLSEQIARTFLRHAAPDLLAHMQISSIRVYRHPIRIFAAGRSQTVQLTGMWVKARNTQDGSWFWVIVDGNRQPMIFERDVQWSNIRFRRSSEHWLYDPWLKAQQAQ
jgi:hypothetical protein